jgi:hypothetical protein
VAKPFYKRSKFTAKHLFGAKISKEKETIAMNLAKLLWSALLNKSWRAIDSQMHCKKNFFRDSGLNFLAFS